VEFLKAVVAYVSGMFMEEMPERISSGHAGAIIEGVIGRPTVNKKILAGSGVHVVDSLNDILPLLKRFL